MEHLYFVRIAEQMVAHAAWAHPRPRTRAFKRRKTARWPAVLAGVFCAATALASPVKVTHDIRADGPSTVTAEGVLKAPPEAIWKQIIRFNEYSTFMPRVLESFFISEDGVEGLKNAGTKNANKLRSVAKKYRIDVPRKAGGVWSGLLFMVLDTPFPVENRWYVIRSTQDETKAAQQQYQRCWELVTGNIASANGCWTLGPGASPSETVSRYQDRADPGGKVPQWVTRLGATQTIPQMFEKVEKLAAQQDQ